MLKEIYTRYMLPYVLNRHLSREEANQIYLEIKNSPCLNTVHSNTEHVFDGFYFYGQIGDFKYDPSKYMLDFQDGTDTYDYYLLSEYDEVNDVFVRQVIIARSSSDMDGADEACMETERRMALKEMGQW